MKKLFIAKDFNNNPIGVLLAETSDQAGLFWLGKGLQDHYSTEEIDPSDESIGCLGVVCVMSSQKQTKFDINHKSDFYEFRTWKRGS